MGTIRRGDQTTTDEWLARRPKGEGAPQEYPRPGDIVLFRSVLSQKTGGIDEVPAIVCAVRANLEFDLVVFRANGLDSMPMSRVPYNADTSKAHTGAWRCRD